MSTFFTEAVDCPHCGATTEQSVAHSVNATRSPHYRQAILAGTFQTFTCSHCHHPYQVDRPFFYVDFTRHQWIGVFPLVQEPAWQELETEPVRAFERACGANAPAIAQGAGKGMKIRTVFGLLALREKLICFEAGLDDVVLELLKFRLMLAPDGFALIGNAHPRLIDLNQDRLVFAAPIDQTEPTPQYELVSCPQQAYDDIASDHEFRASLEASLNGSPYVDCGKLLL